MLNYFEQDINSRELREHFAKSVVELLTNFSGISSKFFQNFPDFYWKFYS